MTIRLLVADNGNITVDSWPGSETGPCAKCHVAARIYGPEGNPLCTECQALLPERETARKIQHLKASESQQIGIPEPREPEEEIEAVLF